jgi:hypothetical protein
MNFANIGLTESSIYFNANLDQQSALTAMAAPSTNTAQIFFFMKRVTNQVEQARMSVSPFLSCFLQQQQPMNQGSATFNQSFAENQISAYQQLLFINAAATNSSILEEYTDAATTYQITRCGVQIVNAANTYEAKQQLQLNKSVDKYDYNNFVITFDTVFTNANVQTIITTGGTVQNPAQQAIAGYHYITQATAPVM